MRIDNSDFDFMDSSLYERYEPLAFENNRKECPQTLFGRDNKKVAEVTNVYRAFRKKR